MKILILNLFVGAILAMAAFDHRWRHLSRRPRALRASPSRKIANLVG